MKNNYEIHHLEWSGIAIEVQYCRSWFEAHEKIYGYPLAHIEVRSITPRCTPLPITETGYRSHFISADEIEAVGGPVAFIHTMLDDAAKDAAWIKYEVAINQMSLF